MRTSWKRLRDLKNPPRPTPSHVASPSKAQDWPSYFVDCRGTVSVYSVWEFPCQWACILCTLSICGFSCTSQHFKTGEKTHSFTVLVTPSPPSVSRWPQVVRVHENTWPPRKSPQRMGECFYGFPIYNRHGKPVAQVAKLTYNDDSSYILEGEIEEMVKNYSEK